MDKMRRTLDGEGFEGLYRSTAAQLFGYLRRRGAADPEDLVAEVYAIAWRRRSDLPAPELRRAWLFGTARRLLYSQGRLLGRERDAVRAAAGQAGAMVRPVQDDGADGSPSRSGDRLTEVVAAALGRLEPDDQEIIRLSEWEQMTAAELAVAFGIRPGTARVRLHRARQKLAADPDLHTYLSESTAAGINTAARGRA